MTASGETFVFVHGAWHTGRVWDPVVEELRARGAQAIAPDLPSDDVSACSLEYAKVIVAKCQGLTGEIVVVGHTSGCLILPLLPDRMPIGRFAYVNPLLPMIGDSFSNQMSSAGYKVRKDSGRQYDREARSYWTDRELFRELLAADCADEEIDRIWAQMRRQARCPISEVTPLERWPETPSSSIVYTDDADLPVEWMKDCAKQRLGVESIELAGSQLGFLADPKRFVDALTT
jgi:pimeloyl-ACP methyl ester carboxylesterase